MGSPGYVHLKVMVIAQGSKIRPASPYQVSAGAISAIIPLAKAHSRAQSKEVGKYLPPTTRQVLQSHMTKGMDTGRGVEQGH